MDHFEAVMRIFSPRWGTEDGYILKLSRDYLVISHGTTKATCRYRENQDPVWEGDSIEDMLTNDGIYPPSILPEMLETAWLAWRSNELDGPSLQMELEAIAAWINLSTKKKPGTEFWKRFF